MANIRTAYIRKFAHMDFFSSIFYIISDLVPIKRESSRRKAKEGNLKKMHMQERLLEDDDEGGLPGLDLSDSDDDATWNPQMDKPANDMRSR